MFLCSIIILGLDTNSTAIFSNQEGPGRMFASLRGEPKMPQSIESVLGRLPWLALGRANRELPRPVAARDHDTTMDRQRSFPCRDSSWTMMRNPFFWLSNRQSALLLLSNVVIRQL
jgi:hypothetical protein